MYKLNYQCGKLGFLLTSRQARNLFDVVAVFGDMEVICIHLHTGGNSVKFRWKADNVTQQRDETNLHVICM